MAMRVVICGAGAISTSTAYYLSKRCQCELSLRLPVANAACGRQAGFSPARSTDLTAFDPIRLPPRDPASLRVR
jgi:glycine/D-amino acid oxidase-like deaminating enzyme